MLVALAGGGARALASARCQWCLCTAAHRRLESTSTDLPHVVNVYFKCFRCFIGMLQLSHTNIVKVDRDIAYVAVVVHVCLKLLFSMFHLFFSTYVASLFI
jgi:hypothetical protein